MRLGVGQEGERGPVLGQVTSLQSRPFSSCGMGVTMVFSMASGQGARESCRQSLLEKGPVSCPELAAPLAWGGWWQGTRPAPEETD